MADYTFRMAKPKSLDEKIDSHTLLVEKRDTKIDALASLVEKGFAAVSEDLALRPTTAAMTMLLDDHLLPLSRELASIRRDLGELAAKVHNVMGFAKDIDHALERIAAIEKHLGLNNKIAA